MLSGLQLTASFPNVVLENFYRKTQNSIDAGKTEAPYGYVLPVAARHDACGRDGQPPARPADRSRPGDRATSRSATRTFPAGSYVIKRNQPYGRLAKNLLERQVFPDPNLRTYDDSGWTMGLAMMVDVKEIADKAILDVPTTRR